MTTIHRTRWRIATAAAVLAALVQQPAAETDPLAEIRGEVAALRAEYESRIATLEARLAAAERDARDARGEAAEAVERADTAAIAANRRPTSANALNPALGAVLIGRYADLDAAWEAVPGFRPGGEIGPGASGFSLGEAEINLKASIDDAFFGNLTLALEDEDGETEVAVEEAWLETTALPHGLTLRAGRQFSGIGYLNGFHRHADDFVDRPLPYQAMLGGQYIGDGVQLRWVAPTPLFLEIGAELDWGGNFPAAGSGEAGPDAWSLFAHVGGDVGASHAWQAGLSYLAVDAGGEDAPFAGDSDLVAFDFVWKWAPLGNPTRHSFKLQGEYFDRREDGVYEGLEYDGDQTAWYLQGVWQFAPGWRLGYRHDRVDADNDAGFAGTALAAAGRDPRRDSLMLDWSHTEFSRVRIQYTRDRVLPGTADQLFLQYLVSVGAHGAHRF